MSSRLARESRHNDRRKKRKKANACRWPEFSREFFFHRRWDVALIGFSELLTNWSRSARSNSLGICRPERERRISVCFPTESLEFYQNYPRWNDNDYLSTNRCFLQTYILILAKDKFFLLDRVWLSVGLNETNILARKVYTFIFMYILTFKIE